MKRVRVVLFLIAIMVLDPLGLVAQVRPHSPPRQRQELMSRVQQGFGRMIQTQMGLDQDELMGLQEVMQSFREDRQALNQDQASLRYGLRDPALPEMAHEDAMAILDEMVRLQEVELELYRKEMVELLKVLSPVQVVQFYRIRDEWGQRIQRLRQGGGPGGLGGPGGPGGPGGTGGRPGGTGGSMDWLDWFPQIR